MTELHSRAACDQRNGTDPELFFPAAEPGSPAYGAQVAAAKSICGGCPVQDACLAYALDSGQDDGVWGGLDGPERRELRSARLLARHRQTADQRHARAARKVPGGPRRYGRCAVCGNRNPLRLDGLIGKHDVAPTDGGGICFGVGSVPTDYQPAAEPVEVG
jgi:WhiB family transcriptional regulator, redox-sensing transcriptional regulator